MTMLLLYLSMIEDHSDDERFEGLYREYEETCLRIAHSLTGNRWDAEEAVQNAFFALAKNIHRLEGEDNAATKSYIFKSVRNAALNILRKRKKLPETVSMNDFYDLDSDALAVDAIEEQENRRKMVQIMLSLPLVYRDVLFYSCNKRYPVRKIARLLQRPITTVKSQLSRAKRYLKQKMKEAQLL